MSEINNNSTEKIAIEPEEIGSTTEKIDENSEKITSDTEKIGENSEKITSETEKIPKIIRYRGQRGPDKTPRIFNANSRSNLKQYQNIPLEKSKGSDKWIWIVIGIVVAILFGILMWRIYESRKEKQNKEE